MLCRPPLKYIFLNMAKTFCNRLLSLLTKYFAIPPIDMFFILLINTSSTNVQKVYLPLQVVFYIDSWRKHYLCLLKVYKIRIRMSKNSMYFFLMLLDFVVCFITNDVSFSLVYKMLHFHIFILS